jgi:hypothetical protein
MGAHSHFGKPDGAAPSVVEFHVYQRLMSNRFVYANCEAIFLAALFGRAEHRVSAQSCSGAGDESVGIRRKILDLIFLGY